MGGFQAAFSWAAWVYMADPAAAAGLEAALEVGGVIGGLDGSHTQNLK